MIHLVKGEEPEDLKQNYAAWTKVLLDHELQGTKASEAELSRYSRKEIKDALKAETNHKCAYCESKFEHVTYGDVEHIVPKKNGSSWRFMWSNLTIACDVCNTGKADKENILDPYLIDPEECFIHCGPIMLPKPDIPDALVTEISLKLNRAPLVERRAERIKYLHRMLLQANQSRHISVREAILDDLLKNETCHSHEFAAMTRSYILYMKSNSLI